MTPRLEDHPRHVAALVQAALTSADPAKAVSRTFKAHKRFNPAIYANIWLAGAGKASVAMSQAAHEFLGERATGGAIAVPPDQSDRDLAPLTLHPAAHPLPDDRNVDAARAIANLARRAGEEDLLMCLISGGGSAHLTLPAGGLSLADLRAVTEALLLRGAPIEDLNAVRKHCDQLKGGGLARLAAPARVWAFILSDVVGDRLDVIASGPTSPDPTTYADALAILHRHGALNAAPAVTAHLEAGARGDRPETVKPGDPILASVENTIVGTNRMAMDAVAEAARDLDFEARVNAKPLTGEAREAASVIASAANYRNGPRVVVFGGETTVTVRGKGKGGRNQELALATALRIDGQDGVVVVTLATDGVDGPTDVAGAVITGETCALAREGGLDPRTHLMNNDSHAFLAALDAHITTGPTGTNVNDLVFVLTY